MGKNMVRAIRFWIQVMGIAEPANDGYSVTPFGELLLGQEGLDRFLEDRRTLWLLHWMLLSHVDDPLFAWDYLFNRWGRADISRTEVLRVFQHEANRIERNLSPVTLEQHFDVFLHTYAAPPTRNGENQEDNLDCPLVELNLIERIGERRMGNAGGRLESTYAFRREPKPDITPELFAFCLFDYWDKRKPSEATLTFRDVTIAYGSIGQVFKLAEMEIRERLERIQDDSNGLFAYQESAAVQRVVCPSRKDISRLDLISSVYRNSTIGEMVENDFSSLAQGQRPFSSKTNQHQLTINSQRYHG